MYKVKNIPITSRKNSFPQLSNVDNLWTECGDVDLCEKLRLCPKIITCY